MSISLEGGGGAIGAPLHPLDPLIDVTTTIHGPIWMSPFKLRSKYVLKDVVSELDSHA